MKVLVVYCHPSKNSFTHTVKKSFIQGLKAAGHTYEVSDLYAEGFHPVMSETEYLREGFYQLDHPVAEDVLREQQRINRADSIVFIYPDFWTASPAMLEGWFQRVWTYGFAYGNEPTMKTLEKAIFLVTMGAYPRHKRGEEAREGYTDRIFRKWGILPCRRDQWFRSCRL